MHGYLLGLLKVALMSINRSKALACAVSPGRGDSLQKGAGKFANPKCACSMRVRPTFYPD